MERRNIVTATLPDRAPVFLHRAGLLVGLLAIIAGIFGMHILTGSHNMPMAGSTPMHTHQVAAEHSCHDGHDKAPMITALITVPEDPAQAPGGAGCTGGDPCAGMSAMGGSCIPSGSAGTLAAPPPATLSFAADTQAPPAAASSYAYLPESPTPTDLCISRT
jgi:hypothetical protein